MCRPQRQRGGQAGLSQVGAHGAGAAQGAQAGFSHARGFSQAGRQRTLRQGFSQAGFAHAGAHGAGAAQGAGATQGAGLSQAATAGPQALGASQPQFTLPQRWQANKSFSPLNRSHRLAQGLHAASQLTGSGAQAFTGWHGAGAAHGAQPPLSPDMLAIRSMLNPWLARITLTTSAPKTILPFIEQTLLYSELG
jgi:hypothetical protein